MTTRNNFPSLLSTAYKKKSINDLKGISRKSRCNDGNQDLSDNIVRLDFLVDHADDLWIYVAIHSRRPNRKTEKKRNYAKGEEQQKPVGLP